MDKKQSKKEDKKHLAKILYIDVGLSQTEIAERLGTNQPQISRWVMAEGWDALKAANRVTGKQIAADLYKRIFEISQLVEKEKRTITINETDQISKLNACIRDLDKSADLPTYMQAFEEFILFMQKQDEDISNALPDYVYAFLTKKATEQNG
jgi:uncharacterized protein YicC (UPF0701 family)